LKIEFHEFQIGENMNFKDSECVRKIKECLESVRDFQGNQIFSELSKIGNGSFGVVFGGKFVLNPSEPVAIKFQMLQDPEKRRKEENALKIMNELNKISFDILSLQYLGSFDIADDQGNLYNIIIEEKADTDLNQIINEKNKNKQAFTDEEKAQIFENLLTNLYMLHMNGIAHNDIKPSNILYYDKFKKYIIRDYGECEKFDGPCDFNKFQSNILRGTASYMSPQLKENYIGYLTKEKKIHDTTHNPFKSDIYSLGVVFLQVHLTGSSPQKKFLCFNDKDKDENILKYLMKQQQNSIDEIIENQIEDFFGKYEKYMEISDEGGLIKYQKKKKIVSIYAL